MSIKSFRFRIYPSSKQMRKLTEQMFLLKDTYNALLKKAKAEYSENGRAMNKFDMDKLLTIMKVNPELYRTNIYFY